LPEHPTALLGTPMLRASFGTLGIEKTNKKEIIAIDYYVGNTLFFSLLLFVKKY